MSLDLLDNGTITSMLALAFLSWWYGPGWRDINKKIMMTITRIGETFSVQILLKSLFDPWHRITTETNNGSFINLQAIVDNTVSRFVGFVVRLVVLVAALLLTIIILLIGLGQLIIWPLLPLTAIVTLILGFIK